ncbi:MAG: hypothetical protein NXY57DRAFT_1105504 [Lentinula lateritia]|nr:MAG: hypothetical protein NXY57DRAFT_1105504 [Lentinula lateritia]
MTLADLDVKRNLKRAENAVLQMVRSASIRFGQDRRLEEITRLEHVPYGRAIFTFGSISSISREAFTIPKFEFAVKLHPINGIVSPDPGKLMPDSVHFIMASLRRSGYLLRRRAWTVRGLRLTGMKNRRI